MEILKVKYTSIGLQEVSIELQEVTHNEETFEVTDIQTIEKYTVFDSVATRSGLVKKRILYTIKAKLDTFVKKLGGKTIHPGIIIMLSGKTFNAIKSMAQSLEEELVK